jgi:predicted metalloprotease
VPRHMKNNEHLHQLQQHLCSGIHKRNRSLDRFFNKEDKRREAVAIEQRVDEYGGVWLEVLDEQEARNDEHISECSLVELVKHRSTAK